MSGLVVQNTWKSYGDVPVLRGLSLQVCNGEIYGFVGANGAGKSTTMRVILGVTGADSGEVYFNGAPVDDSIRRSFGYMPEERGLYAKDRVIDQLVFLARLRGLDEKAGRRSAMAILDRLGLGERAEDRLNALSLGNQQRVQLAAALVGEPKMLVLDEPFSGLDPLAVSVMCEILEEYAAKELPVIFSSHQLDLVQRICHRVGIISSGRMVAEGTVDELKKTDYHRYEVITQARDWYPTKTTVVTESPDRVILEIPTDGDEQRILEAAMKAGEVHGFRKILPDLEDVFKEVMR